MPEWKKRRAEIIYLANSQCDDCHRCLIGCERCVHHDDMVDSLEVHHRYYVRGRKPWEYPDVAFLCLCRTCHEERTLLDDVLRVAVGLLKKNDQERILIMAKTMLQDLGTKMSYDAIEGYIAPRNPYECSKADLADIPAELRVF